MYLDLGCRKRPGRFVDRQDPSAASQVINRAHSNASQWMDGAGISHAATPARFTSLFEDFC